MTMLYGDQYSFARLDQQQRVVEVTEKIRISDHASTGWYYFSNGSNFLDFSDEMIRSHEKTLGEYYVIPVYQKYINDDRVVGISISSRMWDLGTPVGKEYFENTYNQN